MPALRVVSYLNQFFGQIGGEDKAGVGPRVLPGAVGAARAIQQALGDAGRVVATVIAGDNHVAEHPEAAVSALVDLVAAEAPDLLVAGPAFQAGRYGVACGALCAAVESRLGVPAVTGMHAESAVPTVIFNEKVSLVGAVPTERYRAILDWILAGEPGGLLPLDPVASEAGATRPGST